jgi:glycosyltransferase involved in cell wall biosynthesis
MEKARISIIIPAHNEEKRIGKTLSEYYSYFKEKSVNFELVVVINACRDKTSEIVKDVSRGKREIIILEFENGGKGFAIKQGFKDALKRSNSLIGFVDADLSTSPKDFEDLLINLKGYGGIIASRYVKGAKVFPKQPLSRILISRLGNKVINLLFLLSIKDTQCGAKVFKREAIEKTAEKMGLSNWAFDVELLYLIKKQGIKVREFPTVWRDAPGSTLNLKKAGIQALFAVIQLRIIHSPFRRALKVIKPVIKKIYILAK